jgi:hypothetical protein
MAQNRPSIRARVASPLARLRRYTRNPLGWLYVAWKLAPVAWFWLCGGWLLRDARRNSGTIGVRLRLLLLAVRLIASWAVVWVAIWLLAPHALVSSRAGVQTTLQVLPAVIVAVFVLVLGSFFVIAQTAVSTWGTRSPIMLTFDMEIQAVTVRPLILVVAVLLLAGQVPDTGEPSKAVTAAIAALSLATIRMIVAAAFVIPLVVQRYSLPRGFPRFVIESVESEFDGEHLDLVVMRGPMLGEMLRLSLRRGDSVAVVSTAEAIEDYTELYVKAVQRNPKLRTYTLEDGRERTRWFVEDLEAALVRAGEDGLRIQAPGADANRVAICLGSVATLLLRGDQRDDAKTCCDGLVMLATATQQVGAYTNLFPEPAFQLAFEVGEAERNSAPDVAARALAGWGLAMAYPVVHLQVAEVHPMFAASLKVLGRQPPWDEARKLVATAEWQAQFANKQYFGPDPVVDFLTVAETQFVAQG